MKNWKTTLFGSLAALAATASHAGITVGHIGNTDFVPVFGTLFGILFAAYSKDNNVTGGTVEQH